MAKAKEYVPQIGDTLEYVEGRVQNYREVPGADGQLTTEVETLKGTFVIGKDVSYGAATRLLAQGCAKPAGGPK